VELACCLARSLDLRVDSFVDRAGLREDRRPTWRAAPAPGSGHQRDRSKRRLANGRATRNVEPSTWWRWELTWWWPRGAAFSRALVFVGVLRKVRVAVAFLFCLFVFFSISTGAGGLKSGAVLGLFSARQRFV